MRRIYKWRGPGLGFEDITDKRNSVPESKGPAVWSDIEPYEFMGENPYGKNFNIVGSRSTHRELLKLGGYVEVGNQKPQRLLRHEERERERDA